DHDIAQIGLEAGAGEVGAPRGLALAREGGIGAILVAQDGDSAEIVAAPRQRGIPARLIVDLVERLVAEGPAMVQRDGQRVGEAEIAEKSGRTAVEGPAPVGATAPAP